jgi:hypothetical protein
MIVAEREIAEFHGPLLRGRRLVNAALAGGNNAFAIVEFASV